MHGLIHRNASPLIWVPSCEPGPLSPLPSGSHERQSTHGSPRADDVGQRQCGSQGGVELDHVDAQRTRVMGPVAEVRVLRGVFGLA